MSGDDDTVCLSENLMRKNACKSNIIYGNKYLYSGVEGELVLLRIPVSSFTLFCGYLCNVHRV